jgi:zinc transport system permease protein
MIEAIFRYQFLQNAVVSSILASIVCGIIGVIIIEKKWVMMSGGIAHTAYGGVGLGYLLGFEPVLGAFLFSILAAFGVGVIKRKGGIRSDVVIGMFWSLGMALGILFIGWMPGYPPDLSSYLFGSILAVTRTEIALMVILTLVVVLVFILFYQHWKAFLFDEEFAALIGMPTVFMEFLLLVLIAMTVVVLIRVVGIILVLALLIAPAATASLFARSFRNRIILSILTGVIFCFAGLWLSYAASMASGAVIVALSVLTYLMAYAIKLAVDRIRRRQVIEEETYGK